MEITDDGPEISRVIKLLKYKDVKPIGIASDNPILDNRMYEVEYVDGYKSAMAANIIANNLLAQVNQYRQRFVLFYDIIYARIDGTQIKILDDLIHMKNVNKRRL